jgi:uncharacterized protein (UPF0262 family)
MGAAAFRLCDVSLDGSLRSRRTHVERERAIAIHDLLENNAFIPVGHNGGPYQLKLALADARLALHIATERGGHVVSHYLSLGPFRRLLKDYILTCESYYDAMPRASPDALSTTTPQSFSHTHGSSSCRRATGRSAMRASTSANHAFGSMSLRRHVVMK